MTGPKTLEELHKLASRPVDGVLRTLQQVDGNIIVLGAGGKMGFHLAAMLRRGLDSIDSRHPVIAVSRFADRGPVDAFQERGITVLARDLLVPGTLLDLPDAAAVFFLAGVKFGTQADPESLRVTNVELPARVAARYRNTKIVALSTGCVYPFVQVDSGGSLETDKVGGVGEYAQSCMGRERSFVESGAQVSLIRLNYSVDLRYGVLVDIAQKVVTGQPVDLSTGHFNVIWQGDASAFIVQALSQAAAPPWVLNVTGKQTLSVREVAKRFGERFGKPVKFVGTESETAWLSNANLCHQRFGDPHVTEDQLIDWVADWLEIGGETLDQPTHFEVRDGKF